MAIKISTTKGSTKFAKVLVYGKSGIGKTRMIRTAPSPIIISSENKQASLSKYDIPIIKVSSIADFEEALNLVTTKPYKKFKTICVDSVSDIAETAISEEKKNHNDPRKAYIVVQDHMLALLRQIRDSEIKKSWYIIAKAKMTQNDDGMDMYGPKMPGRQMGPELPYLFDYVFPMRLYGEDEESSYTYLQTSVIDDFKWEAKDSSGKLEVRENPDLKELFKKLADTAKTKT